MDSSSQDHNESTKNDVVSKTETNTSSENNSDLKGLEHNESNI